MQTINDKLSNKLAPLFRKLSDLNIGLMGTETQVVRILVGEKDMMGQSTETLESSLIDNVILDYPAGDMRLHSALDNKTLSTSSISLWDFLPITLKFKFKSDIEDVDEAYDENAVELEEGDLIVHMRLGARNEKIPIVMKVEELEGSFLNRDLVSRQYNLTLFRGRLPNNVRDVVQDYVDNYVID